MLRLFPIVVLILAGCGETGDEAAPATASSPPVPVDDTIALTGRQAYDQVCASCHDEGVDGAPRTGDRPRHPVILLAMPDVPFPDHRRLVACLSHLDGQHLLAGINPPAKIERAVDVVVLAGPHEQDGGAVLRRQGGHGPAHVVLGHVAHPDAIGARVTVVAGGSISGSTIITGDSNTVG